jgi:hypothetical protein
MDEEEGKIWARYYSDPWYELTPDEQAVIIKSSKSHGVGQIMVDRFLPTRKERIKDGIQ